MLNIQLTNCIFHQSKGKFCVPKKTECNIIKTIFTSVSNMKSFLTIIGLFVFVLLPVGSASAQQTQDDSQQSLLPEIDPQDIEIRSQFQARFPGLRRQPILGFNPRPRVFQIDPNRMPFIEDEETVVANLPIGELDRPEPPEYDPLGYSTPKYAFVRAGIGSYISPELDAFGIAKITDKNWLSADVHLSSSDGHDEQVTTSYRYADAGIKSFNRLSDKTDLTLKAGAVSNFNHQLQLDSDVEDLLDTDTRISRQGFRGSADLDIANTSLSGISVMAAGFYDEYTTKSDISALEGDGLSSEYGVDLAGDYSRLGNNLYEIYTLRLESEIAKTNSLSNQYYNWSVSTLSAQYERLFNYNTDVHASVGVSGVTDAFNDFIIYFSPLAEIEHTFFRGLKFRAKASASPSHHTYSEIQSENRFFNVNSIIQHQYEMNVLGEIETEPFSGTKLLGGASFQDVKNYLYYTRTESPMDIDPISAGYYTTEFRDATILKVYGGFSQDLKPDVLWISADGYWQVPKFNGDQQIPYTETVSLKATLSYRATESVLLESWGEFAGGREDHNGNSLSSFALIGGRFEISLTEKYGIYGKLLNLLDDNYELWQGYDERGFQGFVGITLLF